MSKFNLPAQFIEDLSIYIGLSEENKNDLELLIHKAPLGTDPKDLSNYLLDKIDVSKDDLESISNMLFVLYRVMDQSALELNEFIDGICASYSAKKEKVDDKTKERLKHILSKVDSFSISVKASQLASERENILNDTRIITDVRPIFGTDKVFDLVNSIIIHNLKIEFEDSDGNAKSLYLALDNKDLKKLREDILRAEKKETILKECFSKSTTFIDIN
jgi:hypothetical protein